MKTIRKIAKIFVILSFFVLSNISLAQIQLNEVTVLGENKLRKPSIKKINTPGISTRKLTTNEIKKNTTTGDTSQQDIKTIINDSTAIQTDCLTSNGGKCGVNVYKIIGVKQSNQNIKTKAFVQDIVLSLTMFFGTVLTIVILFSGFCYIIAGLQGSDALQSKAKQGLVGGFIGLILVSGSFAIVRFIQFIAAGG